MRTLLLLTLVLASSTLGACGGTDATPGKPEDGGGDPGGTDGGAVLDGSSPVDALPVALKTVFGSVTIRNSLEADALDGVGTITGSLTIAVDTDFDMVTLATLEHLGGDLEIRVGPSSLHLPHLAIIDGSISFLETGHLATFDVPVLASVFGIYMNTTLGSDLSLTALSFPGLVTITGTLTFDDNPQLVSLSLPLLTTAMGIGIQNNHALTTLSMPSLQMVSFASVDQNEQLPQCQVDQIFAHVTVPSDSFDAFGNGTGTCN